MRLPKYTCPTLDRIITEVQEMEAEPEEYNSFRLLYSLIEDVRAANTELRDAADHWEKEADELQDKVDDLENDISVANDRVVEAEDDVKSILEELREAHREMKSLQDEMRYMASCYEGRD